MTFKSYGDGTPPLGQKMDEMGSLSRSVGGHRGSLCRAIVVTDPEEPRYLSAPPSQYNNPPPDGFVVGTVVQSAICSTFTPPPKLAPEVVLKPIFPLVVISIRDASAVRSIRSHDTMFDVLISYSFPDTLVFSISIIV